MSKYKPDSRNRQQDQLDLVVKTFTALASRSLLKEIDLKTKSCIPHTLTHDVSVFTDVNIKALIKLNILTIMI